ncbi:hypothetical protein BCR34DRAFT_604909 [Clohesyomyces aquaticus]|uniref:Kinetochore protein mis14 n=1 Tax=Clohesyomyces aquaticus TaxID=1231657 RepID=A0A1Y1Z1V2_9PLEO|nr:hypothetical protein BCR34DRAFT_604909 [Clohesyomyces aquaticus]
MSTNEHRKIDLQSPADLHHIESQIRRLATQKLNLHLPPVAGAHPEETDDLRVKTESLVSAFVDQVLSSLRKNVAINGIEVEVGSKGEGEDGDGDGDVRMEGSGDGDGATLLEEFEPRDEQLRARLQKVIDRRDRLVADISRQRRVVPGVAAKGFEERYTREWEEGQRAWEEQVERASGEEARGQGLDVKGFERADEVQRLWERSVEGLGGLKGGLPETRARLERCGDVVGYLEGKNKGKA